MAEPESGLPPDALRSGHPKSSILRHAAGSDRPAWPSTDRHDPSQHLGLQRPGNYAAGYNAAALNFLDNWRDVLCEATGVCLRSHQRAPPHSSKLGTGSRNRAVTPVTMSLQELQSTRKQSLTIVPSVAQRLILLAGRTGCRHCSRASSARAGSSVSIRRRHCAHRLRRNCRRDG